MRRLGNSRQALRSALSHYHPITARACSALFALPSSSCSAAVHGSESELQAGPAPGPVLPGQLGRHLAGGRSNASVRDARPARGTEPSQSSGPARPWSSPSRWAPEATDWDGPWPP